VNLLFCFQLIFTLQVQVLDVVFETVECLTALVSGSIHGFTNPGIVFNVTCKSKETSTYIQIAVLVFKTKE
jgi:hypothetical protein